LRTSSEANPTIIIPLHHRRLTTTLIRRLLHITTITLRRRHPHLTGTLLLPYHTTPDSTGYLGPYSGPSWAEWWRGGSYVDKAVRR
jgi:hypothetical protein